MKIFQRLKLSAAPPAPADFNDVDTEITLLQNHVDNDSAADAAQKLEGFPLSTAAKKLLERSMDNVGKNKGDALPEEARVKARLVSDLVESADGNFNIVVDAIAASSPDAKSVAGLMYSTCFSLIKSAVFLANLDYRQWLDPTGDQDVLKRYYDVRKGEDGKDPRDTDDFSPDDREDDSPLEGLTGHATSVERTVEQLNALYGERDLEDGGELITGALRDLRYFLQLITEVYGWDPTQPMPYSVTMEANGSFMPVTDVDLALDTMEIKRQESKKRRNDATAAQLAIAIEKSRAALKAALA